MQDDVIRHEKALRTIADSGKLGSAWMVATAVEALAEAPSADSPRALSLDDFHNPDPRRLPSWLERFADVLDGHESTRDLFDQYICGLRNWAKILRLAADPVSPPSPPESSDLWESLHLLLTKHSIASRSSEHYLTTDLVKWAADGCRQTMQLEAERRKSAAPPSGPEGGGQP